ncbi:hypothetical protein LPJ66_000803 [Kickxella alabastrina]|uniref:Uncharacterized protein n=1 Tax=Kickxella alabastrina TaxID=61397 RepID=A0ACC1IV17_9FUNG|nr:hypothetical protein LPJ66_000803 [Kickxella alabastrina]
MDILVDPRGKADLIMLIVISAVYSIDFLAVVYMLWNRNYPPIKSKNVIIMTLLMTVSIVWFIGDLQSNGHLPLANTPLTNCKAFGMWMRVLLGAGGMCSLIALRAYGLYRVFFLFKPYHSMGLYLPFFLYWICAVIVGLILQFLKPAITTQYVGFIDLCEFHNTFLALLFVFLWLSLFMVVAAHWMIRNIKSSFNEGREMMVTCVIMFTVLLTATVVNYSRPQYPLEVYLRIFVTSIDHIATNSLWWLIMGKSLYKCVFYRQRYLDQWIYKLRKDGLQKEYEVDSNASMTNEHESSNSYNMRSTLLMSNTADNRNVGAFYTIDEIAYENKNLYSRDNAHANYPQLPKIPLLLYKNTASDCPNRYMLPLTEPQLYAPISVPGAAVMPPLKLSAAHNINLDHLDSNQRQLL